jgi:hypothetical protein
VQTSFHRSPDFVAIRNVAFPLFSLTYGQFYSSRVAIRNPFHPLFPEQNAPLESNLKSSQKSRRKQANGMERWKMNLQAQEFGGEKYFNSCGGEPGLRLESHCLTAGCRGMHSEDGTHQSKLPVCPQTDGTIGQHRDLKTDPGANDARRFWPLQTRKQPRCKHYSGSGWSPTEKYAQSG